MARQILTDNVVDNFVDLGLMNVGGGFKLGGEIGSIAKTGDYTVATATDPSGTVFTNRGAAGEVIFTLPAAAAALKGVFFLFMGVADQNIVVKPSAVDTLLTKNDATADSLAAQTSGEKIGALILAVCDGTVWAAFGLSVGHTFTVAT